MGVLHNFTVSVLVIAVVCFFCEALSMDGALTKYTSCVTGLVVSLVLVNAILQVRSVDFSEWILPVQMQDARQIQSEEEAVTQAFCAELEAAVAAGVAQDLGIPVQVRAAVTQADGVLTVTMLDVTVADAPTSAVENYVQAQFGIKAHVERR